MLNEYQIKNWFTYHSPTIEQAHKYEAIREAGRNLATVICATTPEGPDQSDAIRKVREAVMTANQAIACHTADECTTKAWQVETPDPRQPGPLRGIV